MILFFGILFLFSVVVFCECAVYVVEQVQTLIVTFEQDFETEQLFWAIYFGNLSD